MTRPHLILQNHLKQTKMYNIFLFTFLGYLSGVCGMAENPLVGNTAALEELQRETGDAAELDILWWTSESNNKKLVNLNDFGAVGDGVTDDTQAFHNAWNTACSAKNAVLLVPKDHRYLVSTVRLKGPCAGELIIQIDGTIVAPRDPSRWDVKDLQIWLCFSDLKRASFRGEGVIDGSGAEWWTNSCKTNRSKPCTKAPTALTVASSSVVMIEGLTIKNSQQMNLVISRSNVVRVDRVKVSTPGNSPNTDGIHITESTNVVVQDTIIAAGDDCISIVNGSSNIKVKRVVCGPGHGISIGSLGKDNSVGIVTAVVVETVVLRGTNYGLRIKTWQGGSGHAMAISFADVRLKDVANPILIDQFYCDSPTPCSIQKSAVKVSKITYQNISGTTSSLQAMKFSCSDTVPCTDIVLRDIKIERSTGGSVETYCHSASGFYYGVVQPSAICLTSHDMDPEENRVHTEL